MILLCLCQLLGSFLPPLFWEPPSESVTVSEPVHLIMNTQDTVGLTQEQFELASRPEPEVITEVRFYVMPSATLEYFDSTLRAGLSKRVRYGGVILTAEEQKQFQVAAQGDRRTFCIAATTLTTNIGQAAYFCSKDVSLEILPVRLAESYRNMKPELEMRFSGVAGHGPILNKQILAKCSPTGETAASFHLNTMLPDGQVLLFGGWSYGDPQNEMILLGLIESRLAPIPAIQNREHHQK
jgi:hypothetical protein